MYTYLYPGEDIFPKFYRKCGEDRLDEYQYSTDVLTLSVRDIINRIEY